MPRVHRKLVAVLRHALEPVDVGEVELGVDPLREQVHREVDDIDVAGAFAVAEQGALDPVRPGHHRQLRRRHPGAAVVVGMEADDAALAIPEVADEPLDLVRVDVGRRHLDRRREVDDGLLLRRRLPHVADRLADRDRVVELGAREALRRVLVDDLGAVHALGQLAHELRAADRDVGDAVAVEVEHHAALQGRGRVVEVEDGAPAALDGLEGAADQRLPGLGQHLDGHVVGNAVFVDELAREVEVGLRGRGESDLDLLEPHVDEGLEHVQLAPSVHRVDEGLVAVAQIDAAPHRGAGDGAARPLPVRQIDRLERLVLLDRHPVHGGHVRNGSWRV